MNLRKALAIGHLGAALMLAWSLQEQNSPQEKGSLQPYSQGLPRKLVFVAPDNSANVTNSSNIT